MKLGKLLQRDLTTGLSRQFVMDSVTDTTEAALGNLPSNKTADYIRIIGSDGESYKIPRADFASIIRTELFSLLNSDSETSVAKVVGLTSNAMKSITAANLASVLGGMHLLLPCLYVKYVASDGIPSQGWYRLFQSVPTGGMGVGSYMIHVSSGYIRHEPSPMTFLLEASFNHHGLFQIGNKMPSVTAPLKKVRAVQKSNRTVYFDINVIAGDNWYVTIYPLNGETSNINTVGFTNVTSEDVGTNVTEVTPA